MGSTVSYTAMEFGTQQDCDIVNAHFDAHVGKFADQVMAWMRQLDGDSPYKISRLEHCLQTATRAENDAADEETIVCALLHDIGDILAPANHSQVAAALLAPYVSEKNYWIIKHHGLFQGYYYFHFMGQDRDAREIYRKHPHYQACVDFCANWDQPSFDPEFESQSLEHFEPMVRAIFAREPSSFF
ncbi:MAG: HD domain-containing protein [Woeseiaceae bacterium]